MAHSSFSYGGNHITITAVLTYFLSLARFVSLQLKTFKPRRRRRRSRMKRTCTKGGESTGKTTLPEEVI